MKKLLFIAACAAIFSAQAHREELNARIFIEGKGACYIPTNHLFRKIYGKEMGLFSAEATGRLYKWLYGWGSVGIMRQNGHSLGEHSGTSILMVPLSFGLKAMANCEPVSFYVGMGAVVPAVHIKDHSPFVVQKRSRWGIGGNWNLGAIIGVSDSIFLDVFGEYTYLKMSFDRCCPNATVVRHAADLSGASVGLGIGFRF